MSGSDNSMRQGGREFRPVGIGLAMTRSCGTCPRRVSTSAGGTYLGGIWTCSECTGARVARKAAKKARVG